MSIESDKIIPPSVIIKQPSFLTKYKNYILIFISLLIVGMTVYFIYKKSTSSSSTPRPSPSSSSTPRPSPSSSSTPRPSPSSSSTPRPSPSSSSTPRPSPNSSSTPRPSPSSSSTPRPSPNSSSTPRPSPSKTIYGKWFGFNGEISITINYDNSLEYFQNSPEYKLLYNYNGRYDPYSQRICYNDSMCSDISQTGAVFKLDDIDNNKAILDYGVDHPKGIFTRV